MTVQVTEAEWKIMEVLWDHSPRTMTEITAILEPTTGWTRHTVITLMKRMLENPNSLSGIYRGLLVNDRLFVELIGENRSDVLAEMRTPEQEKFAVVMREYPSVIRTEYAYALLHEHDAKKAGEFAQRFEKVAASHPYPSDIESERELMAIADAAAQRG